MKFDKYSIRLYLILLLNDISQHLLLVNQIWLQLEQSLWWQKHVRYLLSFKTKIVGRDKVGNWGLLIIQRGLYNILLFGLSLDISAKFWSCLRFKFVISSACMKITDNSITFLYIISFIPAMISSSADSRSSLTAFVCYCPLFHSLLIQNLFHFHLMFLYQLVQ